MRILFHTFVILVAAALGLGAGFLLRARQAAAPAAANGRTIATRRESSAFTGARHTKPVGFNDDAPLAAKLARDLSMSTGVTRWLYWMEALEKAEATDFPRLVQLAHGDPALVRLLAARWAERYPRDMFNYLVAAGRGDMDHSNSELAQALFKEWPKHDLEGAIAALDSGADFGMRDQWRHTVADTVFSQNPERGLELMSDWHIENYGPYMTSVKKWAAADPRHAAEFAMAHPAGYASRLTMETIGQEWAATDPKRALAFAAANPGELGNTLAQSALKTWSSKDIKSSADWLSGVDSATRNHLSRTFVETWAAQDATGALAWSQANLTGSSLMEAISGISKGVAQKDAVAAAGLVSGLEPSPMRAEAAVAVAAEWFPHNFGDTAVKPEAIAWLGTLDSESVRRVLDHIDWSWAGADAKGMREFINKLKPDQVPTRAYSVLARELARTNPEGTLDWANTLPSGLGLSTGRDTYGEWWRAQPDTASKWLNALPPEDPRRKTFFQTTVRIMAWDFQTTEPFAAMTPAERMLARGVVDSMTLPPDKKARVLQALQPP